MANTKKDNGKIQRSFCIPRELFILASRTAKAHKQTMSKFIELALIDRLVVMNKMDEIREELTNGGQMGDKKGTKNAQRRLKTIKNE